jgi:hypothetical protein
VSKIVIGHVLKSDGALGAAVELDLHDLTEYRLLAQGGSGSGKTHTLARVIEQFYGKIQIIILDREGDFVALREHFPDFVIAGKGRDIPADPAAAALLAQKTLEHQFPLIVDMFEMEDHARGIFAMNFLKAMIDAPERLWHPVLVLIDEADELAPERSAGVSESTRAVAGMAKRGRKRGYAIMIGTQRISDVNKSVLSQCRNKIIGFADLDIDLKRSARAIGLRGEEGEDAVENLQRGEFFMRGPAFGRALLKVKVGPVKTNLSRTTSKGTPRPAPPPSDKLKKLLNAELTDLAKQSKEDLRDKESMAARIRELEREVKAARAEKPAPPPPPPAPKVDEKAVKALAHKARAEFAKDAEKIVQGAVKIFKASIETEIKSFEHAVETDISAKVRALKSELPIPVPKSLETTPSAGRAAFPAARPAPVSKGVEDGDGQKYEKAVREVLTVLLRHEGFPFTTKQLAALSGYSDSTGSFRDAMATLAASGFIERVHGRVILKPGMRERAEQIVRTHVPHKGPPTPEDWLPALREESHRQVFEVFLADPQRAWRTHEVAENTRSKYSPSTGSFRDGMARVSKLGLVTRHGGLAKLNQEVAGV